MEVLGAILAGVLAFLGALVGHWVGRKSARELDIWRRREETMRMLRWSSEMAVQDELAGEVGVAALHALGTSELLQPPDQALVDSVIERIVKPVAEARGPEYDSAQPETTGGGEPDGRDSRP